jgi:hypothetical protein
VRLQHRPGAVRATFDDPNLVSCAGLVPVMRLAESVGLHRVVEQNVHLPGDVGSNAAGKVATVVAGMAAGADSIDDLALVRHGGMPALFDEVYAPSTLGSFLRGFTHGHVRQLHAVSRQVLVRLAGRAPLLPGVDQLCFVDVDSMLRRVYGKKKQGAAFGHTKVGGYGVRLRGLHPLLATITTPLCAPVCAAARLRAGNAASARGAASLVAEAIRTARDCGASGEIVVRMDSAFYSRKILWAVRRAGARFSVTARMDAKVQVACQSITADAWVDIKYPQAIWDEAEQRWISDAQIAEVPYTAFEHTRQAISARLIVRRVKRLDRNQLPGQGELLPAYRYHAVFTDSPFILLQAESHHRGHAVIEQVNADLINGPLAHLPSGRFAANAAWLTLAAIAHNLTRAAAALTTPALAKARAATIRARIINIAARVSSHARAITLHLPKLWPWQQQWDNLFAAANAPPT